MTGLGVADREGNVFGVLWPHGFTARRDIDGIVLVDTDGRVRARLGQRLECGGGYAANDAMFVICPASSIRVVEPPR